MAIKMVRQPSETPNINNTDDFIPIRYGYGNQNGYIKNKGNEIGYTINSNNFTITSGRIVLQGVECDIDANGYTITTNTTIASPLYYTIYYEVDLDNNEVSIKSENDTTSYPVISEGDDLTHTINGVARLVLYKFISTAGVITNVQKLIQEIKYIDSIIEKTKNEINNEFNNSNATQFGDYIVSKKKLLWSGNISNINDNPVNVFEIGNDFLNKKYQVYYKDNRNLTKNFEFCMTETGTIGVINYSNELGMRDISQGVAHIVIKFYYLSFRIYNSYFQFANEIEIYDLDSGTIYNEYPPLTITKIYEIIE